MPEKTGAQPEEKQYRLEVALMISSQEVMRMLFQIADKIGDRAKRCRVEEHLFAIAKELEL